MFTNRALSEPIGYKGTAKSVITSGLGTPMADPSLKEVFYIKGVMPEGINLVTSPSIAGAMNDKGFLVPADGTLAPYGVIGACLRSTEHLKQYFNGGKNAEGAVSTANNMDDLHGITPTVYQAEALFERGYAYKNDGATKSLFEFKPGQLLRPITATEIATSIGDDTLPVLFGETKTDCPKTKAYYAGMPVVFTKTDDPTQIIGRVSSILPGNFYDNMIYTNGSCFDFEIAGKNTAGLSRNVYNSFEIVYKNSNYEKKIVEFYVTM